MAQSLALIGAARSSVMIASPYFMPGAGGLSLMQQASAMRTRHAALDRK